METLKAFGIGVVCAALTWVLAYLILDRWSPESVKTFTNAIDLVTTVVGFVTLFSGLGAWLVKASSTTGGFLAIKAADAVAPATLTIAGAILLAA